MPAKAFFLLLCCSLTALAESPGPTNPNGPSLAPPDAPRTGTESIQDNMSPDIERGTLIDERSLKQPNTPDRTEPNPDPPTSNDRIDEPAR